MLIIRRVEPSDAKAVQAIYHCPQAYANTLQLPLPSVDMWQQRLSSIPEHVHAFVAELDGKVVGNIGLEVCTNARRRHVASFGMGVKDHYAGQGIGSELLRTVIELCDQWLNIKRLELTVYTDNQAAIHLYQKFGFNIEGECQAFAFRDGDYVNAYHMARINTNRSK